MDGAIAWVLCVSIVSISIVVVAAIAILSDASLARLKHATEHQKALNEATNLSIKDHESMLRNSQYAERIRREQAGAVIR